jgi:hypothetical protein
VCDAVLFSVLSPYLLLPPPPTTTPRYCQPRVHIDSSSVNQGDNTTERLVSIRFVLTGVSNDFTVNDVITTGGILSNFHQDDLLIYRATFTTDNSNDARKIVTVLGGAFTDSHGEPNHPSNTFEWNYYTELWRVSNAGSTDWRPGINLYFFADAQCNGIIEIPPDGGWDSSASACNYNGCDLCSGWDNVWGVESNKGCRLAIDGDPNTDWRPGDEQSKDNDGLIYEPDKIWMTIKFHSPHNIVCIQGTWTFLLTLGYFSFLHTHTHTNTHL